MQLQLYGNKIWVYNQAIDFRASIDGLTALIVNKLKQNPQTGIYLFFNRNRDKIKCLLWHKNGYALVYKRLEKGKFYFASLKISTQEAIAIKIEELSWLLAGLP